MAPLGATVDDDSGRFAHPGFGRWRWLRGPSGRWLGVLAVAALFGLAGAPAHAGDAGLFLDLGGRAYLGNRNVPRESSPLAFHVGADLLGGGAASKLTLGARYDQFLLARPDAHPHILRGTAGYALSERGVDFRQVFTGFRQVHDMRDAQGRLGGAGGPVLGYAQRYGYANFHVFWEVAALTYLYTHGGGNFGLEGRLRVAYNIATIEWYLRFDPATGAEFGVGFGGASAMRL